MTAPEPGPGGTGPAHGRPEGSGGESIRIPEVPAAQTGTPAGGTGPAHGRPEGFGGESIRIPKVPAAQTGTPAGFPARTGDAGPAGVADRLRGLGPLASGRPPASLGQALAGVGGALVAGGVVWLAGDRWASTGSANLAVVLTTAVLAAGVGAMVWAPPPVRVAGVAASGLAAPAVAFFLNAGGGFPSVRGTAVFAGLLLAGLYAVGPWRGHTFHLAILVVAGWLLALSLTDIGFAGTFFGGFATLGDILTGAGVASMATGALYLGAGWWLDEEGLEGMATPFLAVGTVALPVGTLAVVRDGGDVVGAMAAVAVGAAIALVGGRRGRRGTTWIGVAVATAGVLAVADGLAADGVVVALLVAFAGAGLVALAPVAGRTVGEPVPVGPPAPPAAGPGVSTHEAEGRPPPRSDAGSP